MKSKELLTQDEVSQDFTQSLSIDSLSAIMHWTHLDHVRVVLLNQSGNEVLMVKKHEVWDLPQFEYGGSADHVTSISLCCRDFQEWLQIEDFYVPCFTAVVELLGDATRKATQNEGTEIRDKLLVVESQMQSDVSSIALPDSAEWKTTDFVQDLISEGHGRRMEYWRSMEVLSKLMCQTKVYFFDPRYRFGWFRTAGAFLEMVASSDGAENLGTVLQKHLSSSSTILTVDSSEGKYFLKAPALGSREVSLTVKVHSLFPACSAKIVRASNDLNCFVTREFTHVDIPPAEFGNIVQKLASLQTTSITSIDELRNSGFPLRDMAGLSRKIKLWMKGDGIFRGAKEEADSMLEIGPELLLMCRDLSEFDIPLALCHGDFSPTNATYEPAISRNVLIFDWEYAHVGHPFCDLHRIDADASQEVIDGYLRQWLFCGINLADARRAYDIARKLGWVIRLWGLEEAYNLRKHEVSSFARSVFFRILRGIHDGLRLNDLNIHWDTSE